MNSSLENDVTILTMGPIRIAPDLKRRNLGMRLLAFSLERAAMLGMELAFRAWSREPGSILRSRFRRAEGSNGFPATMERMIAHGRRVKRF